MAPGLFLPGPGPYFNPSPEQGRSNAPPVITDLALTASVTAGAMSADFDPSTITGLVGWYKADALALSDSDPVATWTDSSSGGNNAAQGTSGKRPLYKTNIVNGKPVVRFDGTDDELQVAGITNTDATRTIFVVQKQAANIAATRTLISLGGLGGYQGQFATNTSQFRYFANQGGSGQQLGGTTTNWSLGSYRYNSTSSLDIWLDGETSPSTNLDPSDLYQSGATEGMRIGSQDSTANFYNGDMAEILVYDSALSDADRQNVADYLGAKYALGFGYSNAILIKSVGKRVSATVSTGVGTSFDPTTVTGLVSWYKADSLSLNDGDAVSTWADSSGNSRDLTQATAGKRPLYKTAIQNGKPVVRFDGTDDLLASTSFSFTQPFTRIIVCRWTATGDRVVADSLTSANAAHFARLSTDTTSLRAYDGANHDWTGQTPGSWHVYSVVYNQPASQTRLYTDTALQGSASGGGGGGPDGVKIGDYSGGGFPFQGDVAEMLIYTGDLSTTDRQNLENYLGGKYGLGFGTAPSPGPSIVRSVGKLVTATVTSTASLARQTAKRLTATATATASAIKGVGKPLSATVTTTATIARALTWAKALTATVTATATIVRSVGKVLAPAVTTTANVAKSAAHALTATVTSTASLIKSVGKRLSATVTTTASVVRQATSRLTATLTSTASLIKVAGKPLTATATTAATIARSIGKLLSATATTTATMVRSVGKTLSATVSLVADLIADFVAGGADTFDVALTATVTTTASIVRQAVAILSATVDSLATINVSVAVTIAATVSTVTTIFKALTHTLTATVTTTASVVANVIGRVLPRPNLPTFLTLRNKRKDIDLDG